MARYFTDVEIDDILVSVDNAIKSSSTLAKSENKDALKKGLPMPPEEEGGDAPAMGAPPAPDAGMEGGMPPEAGGMEGEMPPEAGMEGGMEGGEGEMPPEAGMEGGEGEMPPEAGMEGGEGEMPPEAGMGEEGLEEEGEGQELSDDELHQIYSSMAPEELERHYMIIRGLLRNEYQKAEMAEKAKAKETPCSKSEDKVSSAELVDLKKSNEDLKKSLETALTALNLFAAPQRKAVTTSIEMVKKNEGDSFSGSKKDLTKDEIRAEINKKVKEPTLTKSERDIINEYLLNGGRDEDKGPVLEILEGKK